MRYEALRHQVLRTAWEMEEKGLVSSTAGNVSARAGDGTHVVITPSGVPYPDLTVESLCVVTLTGQLVEGDARPSSEWRMHCRVYRERPDVGGVVHTHSPYATALAILRREIPPLHYYMYSLGERVRVAPYRCFGTEALAEAAVRTLGKDNAVLLANHGVLAVGSTVTAALKNAYRVEFLAHMVHLTAALGEPVLLTAEEMAEVRRVADAWHELPLSAFPRSEEG